MQRLCYMSQANFSLSQEMSSLTAILTEARDFNARHHIHGVLYFADGCFLQCLEGSVTAIDLVMQRIGTDSRHQHLHIITQEEINTAIFTNWAMKFLSRQHRVKQFFNAHGYDTFCPEQLNALQLNELFSLFYQIEAQDLAA